MSWKEWNNNIMDEFRSNEGKVGGPFEGAPVLLLTTTGAKSGKPFTTPLVYLAEGDTIYIFASKGGMPTNPDWYHNIRAHKTVTLEVGTEKFDAEATILQGAERDRVYDIQKGLFPAFGDYEKATTRTIPVIAMKRVG